MQKITPSLWFEQDAEEAVNYYVSTFKNSRILATSYYGDAGPLPKGTVLTISFQLEGQDFMALNGGPYAKFTPAISFVVDCKSQEEVDHLWGRLTQGGAEEQCGWLRDKYGISWQIVPSVLGELMSDPDPEKVRRVTEAMLKMVKLDIAGLRQAYNQK